MMPIDTGYFLSPLLSVSKQIQHAAVNHRRSFPPTTSAMQRLVGSFSGRSVVIGRRFRHLTPDRDRSCNSLFDNRIMLTLN